MRRGGAVAVAVLVAVGSLAGCGGSGVEKAAGVASATTACDQLVGLEETVADGQVTNQVANETLDSAKVNADQAAAEDPRWRRLDGDVSAVLNDLVTRQTGTLKAKALDAAAICSPLSTTTTSIP